MPAQLALLGRGDPAPDARFSTLRTRRLPGSAWIAHQTGWLRGDLPLFDALSASTRWRSLRRQMYEREVEVPRLVARVPDDGPGHPVLDRCAALLSARFDRPLRSISMNLYRDGRDSVAPHGDKVGDRVDDYVMAIVSLGPPRPFVLQPAGGGPGLRYALGWGDLLVMGGACQRTWKHGVPKVSSVDGPRLSVMFRESELPPQGGVLPSAP